MQGLATSPKDNCLGWRDDTQYYWWDYEEVARRVGNVAAAFSRTNLRKQEAIGIYSATKPNWVIVSLAATARSLVIVPLYDTLGANSCNYIINQTEMQMLFVDSPAAAKRVISNASNTPSLRQVIMFCTPDDELLHLADKHGIALMSLDRFAMDRSVDFLGGYLELPTPDDVAVIMYTSGTTGDPKGVIHTHRSIVANVIGIDHVFYNDLGEGLRFSKDDVCLHYLPLAHAYGFMVVNWFLFRGASIGFFSGDVLKLMDDAAILQPTFMPMVPRLMNRVYGKIIGELQKSSIKSKLFWYAYRRKLESLKQGIVTRDSIWDRIVFHKIQAILGGRVWFMSVGSAPISNDVLEFFRVVFGALVMEGYGQTESAACSTVAMGPVGGNVGHPIQCNYIKLVDVPDCGYFVKNGKGEICVKGLNVMKGYFKQPEKTSEAIDADGWLHTGDIGMFLPDGSLKIIDRKKNIFKLAQVNSFFTSPLAFLYFYSFFKGEYIAPEKIENVYLTCPEILQVFVDGSTLESFTVAVVVPEPTMLANFATEHGVADKCKLYNDKNYRRHILHSLQALGKESKLNSLENVKNVYLSAEPFSIENGLMTPTLKNKRPELRKRYQEQIEMMYKEGPLK